MRKTHIAQMFKTRFLFFFLHLEHKKNSDTDHQAEKREKIKQKVRVMEE